MINYHLYKIINIIKQLPNNPLYKMKIFVPRKHPFSTHNKIRILVLLYHLNKIFFAKLVCLVNYIEFPGLCWVVFFIKFVLVQQTITKWPIADDFWLINQIKKVYLFLIVIDKMASLKFKLIGEEVGYLCQSLNSLLPCSSILSAFCLGCFYFPWDTSADLVLNFSISSSSLNQKLHSFPTPSLNAWFNFKNNSFLKSWRFKIKNILLFGIAITIISFLENMNHKSLILCAWCYPSNFHECHSSFECIAEDFVKIMNKDLKLLQLKTFFLKIKQIKKSKIHETKTSRTKEHQTGELNSHKKWKLRLRRQK